MKDSEDFDGFDMTVKRFRMGACCQKEHVRHSKTCATFFAQKSSPKEIHIMSDKTPYASYLAESHEKLADTLRGYHKRCASIKKSGERLAEDAPVTAKVMAAFKTQFVKKQNDGEIDAGQSFSTYYKGIFKEKPNGKVEQASVAFTGLVLSQKITEKDYDNCPSDWLQRAGTVVNLVSGKTDHPAIGKVAEILIERDVRNGAKNLRKLVAELKGTIVDANGKTLNADDVAEQVSSFLKNGFGALVLTCAKTFIKSNSEMTEEKAKDFYLASSDLMEAQEKSMSEELLTKWVDERDAKTAPIKIATTPDYKEIAKQLYGSEVSSHLIDEIAPEIEAFHHEVKCLPESAAELDAYIEGKAEPAQAVA